MDPRRAAPDFSLLDAEGGPHSLKDFCGSWLVLYFYPKDDTPACTTEACGFRDLHGDLRKAGAAVVGISADSPARHGKFRDKHELPFLLLSDPEHQAIEAYGVWGEKKMYGKTFMGILRRTFLIDPAGRIAQEFPKVSPSDHPGEVLQALRELQKRA